MNMQKIMLEALTYSDEEITRASGRNLANLVKFEFPVDINTVKSDKIRERLREKKPITFEWAAENFTEYNGEFLYELGKSLVPDLIKGTSLFFGSQSASTLASYKNRWPYAAAMEEGPKVFEYFGELMGRDLWERSANAVSTKFDKDGNVNSEPMDSVSALIAESVPYYKKLNDELKAGYTLIMKDRSITAEVSKNHELKKAVLCGAYLRYMFKVFNASRKLYSESDASKETIPMSQLLADAKGLNSEYASIKEMTDTLHELEQQDVSALDDAQKEEVSQTIDQLRKQIENKRKHIPGLERKSGYTSHTIAHKAIKEIPMDNTGSLDNYGSVLNSDNDAQLKVADLTTINKSSASEYKVYPQYVIDVLRIRNDDTDENGNELKKFVNLLKSTKYGALADVFDTIGTFDGKDNRILPITSKQMLDMLNDQEFIQKCLDANLGNIFKKGGKSWVYAPAGRFQESLLVNVLKATPQETNADIRNARVVPVVVGKSLKNSNTARENTGNGIVAQTHKDMVIANAVATKPVDGGNKKITYETKDTGNSHTITLDPNDIPELQRKLKRNVFHNVIARKVEGGGDGHEYYISIPFGLAFVAMQDEEGNIIRTENMDTFIMGMTIKGKPPKFTSVHNILQSPIGKYCNAVAKLGKQGRIRFNTQNANSAYTKVLAALQQMKLNDQAFSPKLGDKKETIGQLKTVLSFYLKNKDPNMSDSEVSSKAQEMLAPLSAPGLSIYVEKYNEDEGIFEFENSLKVYPNLMKHLVDMYNLDATAGYKKNAVIRILEAVAPGVWNLNADDTSWSYANVLRADKTLNGSSDEKPSSADTELGSEDGLGADDGDITDVYDALENNSNTQTADDGGSGPEFREPYDVAVPDSEREIDDALDNAIDEVFTDLFERHDINPSTKHDADYMKRGLINKFAEMKKNNELNLPGIEQAVEGITGYKDFNDFMEQFRAKVYKLVNNQRNSYDDDSLSMAFFAESGKSNSLMANVVKNVLTMTFKSDNAEDMELVPEIGGLMAKFAFAKSGNTGDMTSMFDRDYLTTTFDETFASEYQALTKHLADLNQKAVSSDVNSMDAASRDDLLRDVIVNTNKADIYQKIEQKIDSDAQYVARVADIIVRNSEDIRKRITGFGKQTDASDGGFVPFRAETAWRGDGAGNAIIDFCMYDFEGAKEKENVNKLTEAFGDATVGAMMDALVTSVPSECIDMDSFKDEKSIEDLDQNQLSTLMSYIKDDKAKKYHDAALEAKIKNIYLNHSIEGLFAVDTAKGETSPYTYSGTGEQINLHSVNQFFDSLMKLADSYNVLGTSKTTDGMKHVQITLNNEEMDKHVLCNQYFLDLKTAFETVYKNYVKGGSFSTRDKQILDLVARDVLSNPMNVLINNNVKLVTAYVYHTGGIDKTQKALYQSNQRMGFGGGETSNPNLKGLGLGQSLTGVNSNYDKKMAVLSLTERLNKSENFVYNTLPAAEKVVGNADNAIADYDAYLDSIDGDGANVRTILNQVLNARPSGKEKPTAKEIGEAQNKERENIITQNDKPLFCTYGIDDNTKAAEATRIRNLRTAELIVLLYQTAQEIWEPIPTSSTEQITGIMNANRHLLHSDAINAKNAMIPDDLAERFRNLDAELQLADPVTRREIYGYTRSNNNPAATLTNIMHERESYPENRSGEIIDMFISDEPIDDNKLGAALDESGLSGNPDAASGISTGCKCDVRGKDSNGTQIASNTKLHAGDILVFKRNGVRYSAAVTNVIDDENKLYLISNVDAIPNNAKDVQFVRFQLRNAFQGGDTQDKEEAAVEKLSEWCDTYTPDNVPDDVMFKALCLKNIFAGSGCAKVIKAIISYYVWKLSGYTMDLTPKMDIKGDKVTGPYFTQLRDTIAADLKKYAETDEYLRKRIEKVASDCGIMDNIYDNLNMSDPEEKKSDAVKDTKLLRNTAEVANTKMVLKNLVDAMGEHTGFVNPDEVDDTIRRIMSTPEYAQKLISLTHGEFKEILEKIIRDYNLTLAKPMIEAYKRSCANMGTVPNIDDAFQYLRDNYVERTTTDENGNTVERNDADDFADYLWKNCNTAIGYELTH